MSDMESRVARIEGVVERLERVTEKLTDTVTAIHREFAERRHQDSEIEKLPIVKYVKAGGARRVRRQTISLVDYHRRAVP